MQTQTITNWTDENAPDKTNKVQRLLDNLLGNAFLDLRKIQVMASIYKVIKEVQKKQLRGCIYVLLANEGVTPIFRPLDDFIKEGIGSPSDLEILSGYNPETEFVILMNEYLQIRNIALFKQEGRDMCADYARINNISLPHDIWPDSE